MNLEIGIGKLFGTDSGEIFCGIFQVLWLILYWYYVFRVGTMEKGTGRHLAGFCLSAGILLLAVWLPLWTVWPFAAGAILLFDLFFDQEPFRRQWPWVAFPGVCLAAGALLPEKAVFWLHGLILLIFLLLLLARRESLSTGGGILTAAVFALVSLFEYWVSTAGWMQVGECGGSLLLWGGVLLETLLFFLTEGTLYFYKKGFEFQTERFRKELMEHQYGEIREIYMDMRGWRHDYHNHMQVMKAQLTMGNLEEIHTYLDELEKELDRVDTSVKSGNLMTDAILNSKLTLARRQKISVDCAVKLPDKLPVEDVDLCVILGNLMDNALEACAQVGEKERFLRIYMAVNKSQLYLSVQNSASQEPDFEQQNYITKKRGNHGLGMKRVKAAVDKYNGYLNLANESGIFAAEVSMPLSSQKS